MKLPKLILVDRDGTLNYASSNPDSPFYYILHPNYFVLKPGVREALNLISAHRIPVVLVTKQRCIAKKMITEEYVRILTSDLGLEDVWIEPEANDKTALYQRALQLHAPEDILLIDDSESERAAAERLGIRAFDGSDLLKTVTQLLEVG